MSWPISTQQGSEYDQDRRCACQKLFSNTEIAIRQKANAKTGFAWDTGQEALAHEGI